MSHKEKSHRYITLLHGDVRKSCWSRDGIGQSLMRLWKSAFASVLELRVATNQLA